MCTDLNLSVLLGPGTPKLIARSRTGYAAFEVALTSSEQIAKIIRLLRTADEYVPKAPEPAPAAKAHIYDPTVDEVA